MYTMMQAIETRALRAQQAVILLAAFIIAEVFYKFGSFALECIAFLATWFVLDFLINKLREHKSDNK